MNFVFVYGSLKKGFGNHGFLADSEFFGPGRTILSTYKMGSFGYFPFVLAGGEHHIQGEVYKVDDETFERLDRLESNGSFYQRREVDVTTPRGDLRAWMYFLIDNGDSRDRFDCSSIIIHDGVANWSRLRG